MQRVNAREPTEQETADFGKELQRAAKRQLKKIFTDGTLASDQQEFSTLTQILHAFHGRRWPDNPNQALHDTIEATIRSLPNTENPLDFSVSWQVIALRLYGFDDLTPHKENGNPHDYNSRHGTLKPNFSASPETMIVRVFAVHCEVAHALLKRYYATLPPPNFRPHSSPDPTYVRRLELYAAIDTAINEGHNVIGLVGEGGTGKSTLAERYVQDREPGSPYAFADFRTDDDLAASMHENLTNLGFSTDGLGRDTAWLKLRELFANPEQCPRYVILDNIEIGKQIERLGGPPPNTTVIITARDDSVLPTAAVKIIVDALTKDEAAEVIKLKLPDISDNELYTLKRLHGRALAIDIACAFMQEVPTSRGQFVASLARQAAEAVDLAASQLGRPTIEAMYREIIRQLESDRHTALAVRLLELEVAYTLVRSYFGPTERFFVAYFLPSNMHGTEIGKLAYRAAFSILERCHIIRMREGGNPDGLQFPDRISGSSVVMGTSPYPRDAEMHPLTLEILYKVLNECLHARCEMLLTERMLDARAVLVRAGKVIADPSDMRQNRHVATELNFSFTEIAGTARAGLLVSDHPYFASLLELADLVHEKMELAPCRISSGLKVLPLEDAKGESIEWPPMTT